MKAVPGLRFGNALSLLLFSFPHPFLANFETVPKIIGNSRLLFQVFPHWLWGKYNFLCVLCAFAVQLF